MGRSARLNCPGLIYHVIKRGNNREVVFAEEEDYRHYLNTVQRYKKKYHFKLFAYCLMTNHVHLLIKTSNSGNISRIMQSLTVAHIRWYNYKYQRCGHVWQNAGPHAVTSLSDGTVMTYDANGNLVSMTENSIVTAYTYDVENRLVAATRDGQPLADFEYDGDGGRTKKISYGPSTTTTRFVGSLYEEAGTRETKYIFLGGMRIASITNGEVLYYHTDHLGGTNLLSDDTGALKELIEYKPFGEYARHEKYGSSEEVAWFYFTGQKYDDETGLYFYNARYYNPKLGRFLTPDIFVQAPGDPQSFNRYTYVRNNPVNLIDPTGHFFGLIFAAISAIVEAAAAAISAITIASVVQGAIAGSLIGGAVAAATGGNIGQGFLTGAIGGALFGATGDIIGAFGSGWGAAGEAIAHAITGSVSGGISSIIGGGNFGQGALIGGLSAGVAKYAGGKIPYLQQTAKNFAQFTAQAVLRSAVGAVVGGAASTAIGGSFAQGAQYGAIAAAIGFVANDSSHPGGYLNGKLQLILDKFYNPFIVRAKELAVQAAIEAKSSGFRGGSGGLQDAYRHYRWNQLMKDEFGSFRALMVSTGHEIFDNQISGKQSFVDFKMDMHNNAVGAYSSEGFSTLYSEGRIKVNEGFYSHEGYGNY